MEDSTQEWTQLGPFFSKIRAFFFDFQKRVGGPPRRPSPLVARLKSDIPSKMDPSVNSATIFQLSDDLLRKEMKPFHSF